MQKQETILSNIEDIELKIQSISHPAPEIVKKAVVPQYKVNHPYLFRFCLILSISASI
jgi:hypothetical protein